MIQYGQIPVGNSVQFEGAPCASRFLRRRDSGRGTATCLGSIASTHRSSEPKYPIPQAPENRTPQAPSTRPLTQFLQHFRNPPLLRTKTLASPPPLSAPPLLLSAPPMDGGRGTPPPGDQRQKRPADPPGRRSFPDSGDGRDGDHGRQHTYETTWSLKLGWEALVEKMRGQMYSPGALEKTNDQLPRVTGQLNSFGAMEQPPTDELPGFSLYFDIVHGQPLTTSEELQLKQQLEGVLRQVQCSVKAMGLEPDYLETAEPLPFEPVPTRHGASPGDCPVTYSRFPNPAALTTNAFLKHGYGMFRSPSKPSARTTEARLEHLEAQNKNLVEIFERFSFQTKLFIAAELDSGRVSPESAKEFVSIVECMDKNVTKALNSGGHFLTMSRLLDQMHLPLDVTTYFPDLMKYGSLALFVVQMTDRAIRWRVGSHVQFGSIGNEVNNYTFEKLKLNSDPFRNLSVGVGRQASDGQSVSQIMMKVKNEKNSVSFYLKSLTEHAANAAGGNAPANPNNNIAWTRISVDKPLGKEIKCVLELPYLTFNGKFEVRGVLPCLVYAGGLQLRSNPGGAELPRIPVLDMSAVLGGENIGVGYQLQFRQGRKSSAIGISLRTKLLTVGLKRNWPGQYNAMVCKELVDSSTTIAGHLSYLPQPGQNQPPLEAGENAGLRFCVGLKHSLDPTLYCKARIGSDGASLLVKKSNSTGMWSLKGALHLDFDHPWRVPKIGVLCSFRW